MATTVVVGGIKPDLSILGDTQQFVFNKPNASTQVVNTTTATSTVSPQIHLDFLNASTKGFRLSQSTTTAIPGGTFSLNSLQYQSTFYIPTPLLTFNEGGGDSFAFKKAVTFESTCKSLTPVDSTDVANKSYVDGKTIDSFPNPTGDLNLSGHKITNLARPTAAADATTREYVHQMALCVCSLASTKNLAAFYNNGPTNNGVGATLTNIVNGISINLSESIDSNEKIGLLLIKNQANSIENGIYKIKTAGSSTKPWVLVRAPGFDAIPSDAPPYVLDPYHEVYDSKGLILVANGSLVRTLWIQAGPYDTVGTTPITFTKIAGPMAGSEEETKTLNKKVSLKKPKTLKKTKS